MRVPFLDLNAQHAPIRAELDAAIREVVDSGAFSGGPFVERFEEEFAAYCGGDAGCVGVGSGTEALWLALLAAGIGPGDEVITVPNTFMATAEAITFCGAMPVLVDVDSRTYTMDPELFERAITRRTKAVIPVHLFGHPADMDPLLEIARAHGLFVLEDACQAHGAGYNGRKAGTLGDAGCFSFYPGKNLGAFGEAGAVVTRDAGLREKIRTLRDHGQVKKYHHTAPGWNARMDGIQAAVLRVKLRRLEAGNEARRRHAAAYDRALGGTGEMVTPAGATCARHVYHIYAIRVPERDEFLRFMAGHEIGCGVHYPVPIHRQEAYQSLGYPPGAFPVSEQCAAEFVSLPMFPELAEWQVETVVQAAKEALTAGAVAWK